VTWAKDHASALAEGSRSSKPILIDFGAEWCGFCKRLDRETFGEESVQRLLAEHFVAVKVDIDREPELAKKFAIEGVPTVIFLSSAGQELSRMGGFRGPAEFLPIARGALETSASFTKIREAAESAPTDSEAQRAYARALSAAGDAAQAEKALRTALESKPETDPARAGLLLDLADTLRLASKNDEARKVYRDILALDVTRTQETRLKALLPYARTLLVLKDARGAASVLDEFLASVPQGGEGRIEALFLRGYARAVLRETPGAVEDLKTARDTDAQGRWGVRAALILEAVEGR
jgi:thioredoxin-like negative regulator of GroEL